MRLQPLLPEFPLKKLHFTLSCFALISSLKLAAFITPALQAAQKTSATSSKSTQTVPKPATASGVKSSKTSSRKKVATSRSRKYKPKGQRTIEAARVLEIQNALATAGYYKESPNGQWDDSTSKAMSAYQQDHGFRTTGKPDALSLKKLGL